MTSVTGRRHLKNIARDSRAAICIDVELPSNENGIRPNRQIKAKGRIELLEDHHRDWTRRITLKYIPGDAGQHRARLRSEMERTVLRLQPDRLIAIGAG